MKNFLSTARIAISNVMLLRNADVNEDGRFILNLVQFPITLRHGVYFVWGSCNKSFTCMSSLMKTAAGGGLRFSLKSH